MKSLAERIENWFPAPKEELLDDPRVLDSMTLKQRIDRTFPQGPTEKEPNIPQRSCSQNYLQFLTNKFAPVDSKQAGNEPHQLKCVYSTFIEEMVEFDDDDDDAIILAL